MECNVIVTFDNGIDFTNPWKSKDLESARYWAIVLRALRKESPFTDSQQVGFEEWLEKEWSCKILHTEDNYVTHMTGLDISDESYTMLLMRFPR